MARIWDGRLHAPPHWLQAVPPLTTKAVSGAVWTAELDSEPQDYVVIPGQPWLDGFSVGEGLIRQFVAMPPGAGDSFEEQLTGRTDRADHPAGMVAGLPQARFWN